MITLFLSIGHATLYAQKEVRFDQLSVSQGLSSNLVHSIAQDSMGFMWFGTGSGLNRYDGKICKRFLKSQYPSLLRNDVRTLYTFSDGTVVMGSFFGCVLQYDPKMEEFSKTAIETYGISELTAKRTASTYMAMAKGIAGSMNKGVEGWLSEYLYNAGYRKIPEGAVVLTRKDLDKRISEKIKNVLEKVWDNATTNDEVGARYIILKLAEEEGVKLDRELKRYGGKKV